MQTIGNIIKNNTNILENCKIENPKQNVLNIVAHVLQCSTTELFLLAEQKLTKKQLRAINRLVKKRSKNIPFQYIVKQVGFLGLQLKVNKNVLIPRNETEILADMVVKHINNIEKTKNKKQAIGYKSSYHSSKNKLTDNGFKVLDLCCGSGAIGLSVAKNTCASVWLSDISKKALRVAKHNAKQNNVLVSFVKSDLLNNHTEKYNLIVCNPPYVKSADIASLQPEVKNFEPHLALDGGKTGYDFYEKIISTAPKNLAPQGELFLEIGVGQSVKIANMLKQNNFENITKLKDYSNKIRYISANLKVNYDK